MSKRSFTDEQFVAAFTGALNWSEISRKLGLHHTGNRITAYRKICEKLSVDYSHLHGIRWFDKSKIPPDFKWGNRRPLGEILVENSSYKGGSNHIKTRLVKEGIFENKCSKCGNTGEWKGEKLTLQLDHINGNNVDNRLENLRILCPNCHSQTSTYGAKKR